MYDEYMSDHRHQQKHVILTELPGLDLIELIPDDAMEYYRLVDRLVSSRHYQIRSGFNHDLCEFG